MCFDMSSFRLTNPNPDLFHRSEWDVPGLISCLYVIYRLAMAIIMVGGLAAYVFWLPMYSVIHSSLVHINSILDRTAPYDNLPHH